MMRILKFTLSPQAVVRVYDAVLCLAKFSEIVSLEASAEKVTKACPGFAQLPQ